MERENLTDICFVFRILEFEVNFCDFICAAYIVFVGDLDSNNKGWKQSMHFLKTDTKENICSCQYWQNMENMKWHGDMCVCVVHCAE